ncbi:putative methionyl-tRNA synthetase [Hordeum vulgare]|nr:putative methionyl-tRNA synthetase [Hordeum vulgare]
MEQCIADAKSNAATGKEKSDAWQSTLMTNQHVQLDLLGTNVVTKKRNTDLVFLMWADTLTMDEYVKAWYLMERGLILNQMPVSAATTAVDTRQHRG